MRSKFLDSLDSACEVRRVRTMREFAEECIMIPPGGPHEGRYYSCDLQPYTRHFFDTIDNSIRRTGTVFYRTAATGPTQTGKTMTCLVIPILYHQFELEEDTIYGVPTLEMAADKWRRDLLPVIEAGEFSKYLPTSGRGSRKGSAMFSGIDFTNGSSLKMMPAGGNEKQRAGYTARVLGCTEIDGYKDSESSDEGSKVKQMEGRLRAHAVDMRRIYLECTVTVEEGAIWQEYINGSQSVIQLPCPYCDGWVTPEREHFKGWQDAETDKEAMQWGHFACPQCNKAWSEEERRTANRKSRLIHTRDSTTFSFRWSAVNNMFLSMADIAYDEWHAARRIDRENAEREMCQFVWATPYKPPPPPDYISIESLNKAVVNYGCGVVPAWADFITVGCDMGRHVGHWVAVAWRMEDGAGHIVDYGTVECPSRDLGEDKGMRIGLDTLDDIAKETGWIKMGTGEKITPAIGCIDCGYMPEYIIDWCLQHKGWWPAQGQGHTMGGFGAKRMYTAPRNKSKTIIEIGEQYHVVFLNGKYVLQHNVDFGKMWVHQKMQKPANTAGALTLYNVSDKREHTKFMAHLTAEQLILEDGEHKWLQISKGNHYLDALVLAATAARKHGLRISAETTPQRMLQAATSEIVIEGTPRITRKY